MPSANTLQKGIKNINPNEPSLVRRISADSSFGQFFASLHPLHTHILLFDNALAMQVLRTPLDQILGQRVKYAPARLWAPRH